MVMFSTIRNEWSPKVSDFLINLKVNRFDKMRQTVTANGRIFWYAVTGYLNGQKSQKIRIKQLNLDM